MTPRKEKVVVGLSGGVDSATAAARLKAQGWDVTALFMKNWEEDDDAEYCAAREDLAMAERVVEVLDIPLRTVNFAHEYWERVFAIFLREYEAGRTPNPDVLCNREIKFKEFLSYARHLGSDYIATGHYARVEQVGSAFRLLKARDRTKDQSYFLHTLDRPRFRPPCSPWAKCIKKMSGLKQRRWAFQMPSVKTVRASASSEKNALRTFWPDTCPQNRAGCVLRMERLSVSTRACGSIPWASVMVSISADRVKPGTSLRKTWRGTS